MRIQNLLPLGLFSTLLMAPAFAQVGFTIQLGQPNYYGGLYLQGYPNPQYYNSNPVLIEPNFASYGQPVYLRVPPDQRQNWRSYCGRYNACNRKVCFVQDNWYNSVYAPRYRNLNNSQYRSNPGHGHGGSKNRGGHGSGKNQGNGNGRGNGN